MRTFFCAAVVFMLFGCNNNNTPKGIIPKDSMKKVLWDIIQADQFSTVYLLKDSAKRNVKAETVKLYNDVFHLHHITKDQFEKSLHYYFNHPDITNTMFDSLSAQANRQRAQAYKRPYKIKEIK